MKFLQIVIVMLLPIIGLAQKKYKFDYFTTYEQTNFGADTTTQRKTYLTNSNVNSYYAVITDFDSLRYEFIPNL